MGGGYDWIYIVWIMCFDLLCVFLWSEDQDEKQACEDVLRRFHELGCACSSLEENMLCWDTII